MANQNQQRRPNNNSRKSRGKRKVQDRNFQDEFSKREFDKGFRKGEKCSPINTKSTESNAAQWYVPPTMNASDVLTIPESIMSGNPVQYREGDIASQAITMPGVVAYHIVNTLPEYTTWAVTPVNQAGSDLYQAMQSKNSRNPVYDMPLMMMYILAHADILSYYTFLCRVYGIVRNYDMYNMYTPQVLLQAMNIDFESIRRNLADFRIQINQLADAIASLVIPGAFDYIERKIFLYSSIYTDSNTAKAQYYLYVPEGFYKWVEGQPQDPAGNDGLTYLDYTPLWSTSNLTYEYLIEYGWNMVTPLRNSDDVRWIGADMIKAFGIDAMYKVHGLDETYRVQPGYNSEVLSQMENAYIYPKAEYGVPNAPKFGVREYVVQNTGISTTGSLGPVSLSMYDFAVYSTEVDWNNQTSTTGKLGDLSNNIEQSQYLLNFHHDNVTPDELLVASRLSVSKNVDESGGEYTYHFMPETTEFIAGAFVYSIAADKTIKVRDYYSEVICKAQTDATFGLMPGYVLRTLSDWSKFDWSPRLHVYDTRKVGTTYILEYIDDIWDLDNYYRVPATLMTQVNYMAVLGLFAPKGLPDVSMRK